jgi:4-amino-4-deoxy-L-arabinose transferase-like glycosyltransferase
MAEHLRIPLLFALAALVLRAPALLFVELNWDEALYWHIAGEMVAGHAPYTVTWDRKPPGLFALLAAIQAIGGDSVAAMRIGTSLLVAASALAVRAIGRHLLPALPAAGTAGGLAYIVGSMRGVGDGTNAELLLAPFALWSIALALSAAQSRRTTTALAAGLLGGFALLVKQVALAELAVAGLALAALPALAGRPAPLRDTARLLVATAAAVALPAGLALAWYAAIGHLPLLIDVLGAAGDAGKVPFNIRGMMLGLTAYALPIAATLLALAALPVLLPDRATRAGTAILAAWVVAVAAMLLLLGRFADHMMIQALPPLVLATGALAALAVRTVPPLARRPRLGYGAAALVLLGWGLATPALATAETLWRRHVDGVRHWGDRTATIAAAIRPRIEGAHDLFVVGRTLGLYQQTGTRPPTRFPFTIHLWSPYAPLDGMAELDRILAARPAFVVVDDLWLQGGPRYHPLQVRVLDRLSAALAAGYVQEGRTGRFTTWRGGFIGGGIGATVFRRPDIAPFTPLRAAR